MSSGPGQEPRLCADSLTHFAYFLLVVITPNIASECPTIYFVAD